MVDVEEAVFEEDCQAEAREGGSTRKKEELSTTVWADGEEEEEQEEEELLGTAVFPLQLRPRAGVSLVC